MLELLSGCNLRIVFAGAGAGAGAGTILCLNSFEERFFCGKRPMYIAQISCGTAPIFLLQEVYEESVLMAVFFSPAPDIVTASKIVETQFRLRNEFLEETVGREIGIDTVKFKVVIVEVLEVFTREVVDHFCVQLLELLDMARRDVFYKLFYDERLNQANGLIGFPDVFCAQFIDPDSPSGNYCHKTITFKLDKGVPEWCLADTKLCGNRPKINRCAGQQIPFTHLRTQVPVYLLAKR